MESLPLVFLSLVLLISAIILIPDILRLNKEIAELKQIGKELEDHRAEVESRTGTSLEDFTRDMMFIESIKSRLNALK